MSKNQSASPVQTGFFKARTEAARGLSLADAAKAAGGIGPETSRSQPAAIEIGSRIRRSRQQHGWTQIELAQRIGIAQGDLSNIERGGGPKGPSYGLLRKIAVALQIDLAINPMDAETAIIDEDRDNVFVSRAHFCTYAPIFAPERIAAMRAYAEKFTAATSIDKLAQHAGCMVVRATGGRPLIRSADNFVIVTGLQGNCRYEFHKARHRSNTKEFFAPVGLLGPESSVTLLPDPGSSMSVMMIDVGALLIDDLRENG